MRSQIGSKRAPQKDGVLKGSEAKDPQNWPKDPKFGSKWGFKRPKPQKWGLGTPKWGLGTPKWGLGPKNGVWDPKMGFGGSKMGSGGQKSPKMAKK